MISACEREEIIFQYSSLRARALSGCPICSYSPIFLAWPLLLTPNILLFPHFCHATKPLLPLLPCASLHVVTLPEISAIVSLLGHICHPKSPPPEPNTAKALIETILAHLDAGHLQQVVSVLFTSAEPVARSLYARLFQLCSSALTIVQARKVESHLVTLDPTPLPFLLNRAIEAYGKCGCLTDARELFDQMPERDGGSWKAMIAAYVQIGRAEKALSLFSGMNTSRVFVVM